MPDLKNITVNGVPLEIVVREADRVERQDDDAKEIAKMRIIARPHFATRSFRNHSGAKSGKCRVIYSAGGAR